VLVNKYLSIASTLINIRDLIDVTIVSEYLIDSEGVPSVVNSQSKPSMNFEIDNLSIASILSFRLIRKPIFYGTNR